MPKENSSEWPLNDIFGICRQTILPVYRKPTVDSALQTQLLFGECYQVLAVNSGRTWYRIFHEDSRMGGWISAKSLKEISGGDYQNFLNQDYQIVTSPIAAIEYLGTNLYLLPGSRLHFSDLELFNWQDHIGFTGTTRSHALKADREQLIDIALKYVNAPWQAGGRSIFGLDEMLGFALIYSIGGYNWYSDHLPGRIIPFNHAMPGDLFIFHDEKTAKDSFAIYLGMEEVLWMDNRIKVSDLDEWQAFLKNNQSHHVVLEARTVVV
jgi:cell wall-associated NlpC family hydrolase